MRDVLGHLECQTMQMIWDDLDDVYEERSGGL
jgi:hypothetical protein